jgi:hypothetical protein
VLGKWVLRRIYGRKRNEITGEWGRLHNEELHAFYSSPNFILVAKCIRIRWMGHLARMGRERLVQGFGGETQGKEISW